MKRLGGIYLPLRKQTSKLPIENCPIPDRVRIPMLMHAGTPCETVVSVGDYVTVGQIIGKATEENGTPIHASVSGTVTEISPIRLAGMQNRILCVTIEPDGEQRICADCQPPALNNKNDLLAAIKASGCIGLSGAGIPTIQKISALKKPEILIINGAECEPYLSADCRQMIEAPEELLGGILLLTKLLKIKQVRIGIMRNQQAALQRMAEVIEGHSEIMLCPLPPTYPQGAEKVLVYHTCGKVIQENQTAADIGILVLNVSTCAFLYRYSQTGIPLIERIVTVAGDDVKRPCNLRVLIGTPNLQLLHQARTEYKKGMELLCGGLMMGQRLPSPETPVIKQQNGLIVHKRKKAQSKVTPCIRCGSCMRVCPMGLMPMELERAYELQHVKRLQQLHMNLCMNCGCCTYYCPSHHPLNQIIQAAKQLVPQEQKGEENE